MRRSSNRRGFALLLTLIAMAFLVMLLVGLATLSKVETQISDNSIKQLQARQNALMALNVALGELQKYAGPDQRVTATAEAFGGIDGTKHYTGVWNTASAGATPLVWLASGATNVGASPTNSVELVGAGSATANDVVVSKQPITADTVPGVQGNTIVGNFAWWVGDEGVKASLAVADRTGSVQYAPYETAEKQSRLRQQAGIGPGAIDAQGNVILEPRGAANAAGVNRVVDPRQLALMMTPAGTEFGRAAFRDNYHAWTALSCGVLADTARGGLRQDLSLKPELIGNEFAAWTNYTNAAYLESPSSAATPTISPAYSSDPLRRRYYINPATATQPRVAPVLSYFYIQFGVRKQTAAAAYSISVRWAAALWNPYTSALVPESLLIEVAGLPDSVSFLHATTQDVDATVSLRALYGDPLKLRLPWDASVANADRQSWLPGRVYNWVSTADSAFGPGSTNTGRFYSRDIPGFTSGLMTSATGSTAINGNSPLGVRLPEPTTLTVKVYRERDRVLLATYTSPTYDPVPLSGGSQASLNTSQLGFLFRLAESYDTWASDPSWWLTTEGQDPRASDVEPTALRALPYGTNPALYQNYVTISAPERLLDRDITRGTSYNEDTPVFELPRAPIVSVGALQHFYLTGARPFAIGNPWGEAALVNGYRANELFDRFFFSGLRPDVSPDPLLSGALPNPALRKLSSKPNGSTVALADIRDEVFVSDVAQRRDHSSRYLLQTPTFNVNSTDALAWAAVLRAARFTTGVKFSYLDPQNSTLSTAADTSQSTIDADGPQFFRFPQSAQETYVASETYLQSNTDVPVNPGPTINTHLFRRGRRGLSEPEIYALAAQITALNEKRQASVGPFRSLEEFLNVSTATRDEADTPRSLLERAITLAKLNESVAEFSSQWLTQGDLMTALAPLLSVRSDTFIIRAYGESLNPVSSAREGQAWCEALVQRFPEPAVASDPRNPTDTEYQSPGALGRRFKILSVQWLSPSDI